MIHVDVSRNSGIPKWMVYNGKPYLKWMIWGYHYFWKHPCTQLHAIFVNTNRNPLRTLTLFCPGGQRHCFGLWIVELSQNLPKQREKEFLAHRSATTAVLSLQYASTKLHNCSKIGKMMEKYALRYTGDVNQIWSA